MKHELDQWDQLERQMLSRGVRSMLSALAIVAVCIALATIIMGCQPGEQPSTIDLIVQTENAVATAAETVADAVALGTLDQHSQVYRRIYDGMQAASRALDAAWSAYRAGDMTGADGARRSAMDAYTAIRPLIAGVTR